MMSTVKYATSEKINGGQISLVFAEGEIEKTAGSRWGGGQLGRVPARERSISLHSRPPPHSPAEQRATLFVNRPTLYLMCNFLLAPLFALRGAQEICFDALNFDWPNKLQIDISSHDSHTVCQRRIWPLIKRV